MNDPLTLARQREYRDKSIELLETFEFTRRDMAELCSLSERHFYDYIKSEKPNMEYTGYLQTASIACIKLVNKALRDPKCPAANLREVKLP